MRTHAEIANAFAPTSELTEARPFYLVGIGGAGMSGLALMLKRRSLAVSGSDSTPSPATDALERAGIEVRLGHSQNEFTRDQQIVISDAIDLNSNPEILAAKAAGCSLFRRSQLLGWLLRNKRVIAVTGTHGKTTTTGLLGAALRAGGLDPTIIIGAFVPEIGSPVFEGSSDWAVVEACEAYDSFHDLKPEHILLTNLELDHVDFHGSWEALRGSVERFVQSLPAKGTLVYCAEDDGAAEIGGSAVSAIGYRQLSSDELALSIPGEHNRLNASGAIEMAMLVGVSNEEAKRGVAEFGGAERRLELIAEDVKGITVIDDYAHHPTEILASISALRERYPNRRLVVVFQPHLYSRTADQIPEFAEALSKADVLAITDIYPAREAPMPGVSSARIAELATVPCDYVPCRHLLPRHVARKVQVGDVVVGMGAGNISEFAGEFLHELNRPTSQMVRSGNEKLNIWVAYGGDSAEREVSLHSGRAVASALESRGHKVSLVDFSEIMLGKGSLAGLQGPNRPDVVLLAVHGTRAEDGAIQGLLELLHVPYSGSGIQASAIAMDKNLSKEILERAGVRTPKGILVTSGADLKNAPTGPWIVKPNAQGSTVGLSFVEKQDQLAAAVEKALHYDESALVEEWIAGMEISVPVLGDRALNPVEIVPNSGRYDFASKYLPGATTEIVPARLPENVLSEAQKLALKSHQALGCAGATRTDMIVQDGSHALVVLEVNTLPGMTATSLLPNSARSLGIEMPELCEWMALDALERHEKVQA